LVIKPDKGVDRASTDISDFEITRLSAIVKIDRDEFWWTSDAKNLAEVKSSCAITMPDLQPAKMDYPCVVANLQNLQGKITMPEYVDPSKGTKSEIAVKLCEGIVQALTCGRPEGPTVG